MFRLASNGIKRGFIFVLFTGLALFGGVTPDVYIGENAPDFTLQDAVNNSFKLSNHFDKPVVLIFKNKAPSKDEGKLLIDEVRIWMEKLNHRFNDSIVKRAIIRVDAPSYLRSFAVRTLKSETYPLVIDWDGAVFDLYPSDELLIIVVINRAGKISYVISGAFNKEYWRDLENHIHQLIAERNKT